MPETPARKHSIVDVHCIDSSGTSFLVEMQLNWDTDFFQRVFFNASKAYVRQLKDGEEYKLLKPVYSLNFVNGDLHKGLDEWYHPYKFVHIYHTERVFEGLQIVFAELEKYGKQPVKGNTKMDLWMRYFTEMTGRTRVPAPELLADPDIAKAIGLLEVINYNDAELYLYDKYWDAVSIEATWKGIGWRDGEKAGVEKGLQQGLQQGLEEGRAVERRQLALNMLAEGLDPAIVAKISGLTEEELQNLTRE